MSASVLDAEKFSISEAAQKLDVHSSTLFRWTRRRDVKLRVVRIGGRSFILREDLERFIAARSDPPTASETADDVAQRAADAGRRLTAIGL